MHKNQTTSMTAPTDHRHLQPTFIITQPENQLPTRTPIDNDTWGLGVSGGSESFQTHLPTAFYNLNDPYSSSTPFLLGNDWAPTDYHTSNQMMMHMYQAQVRTPLSMYISILRLTKPSYVGVDQLQQTLNGKGS